MMQQSYVYTLFPDPRKYRIRTAPYGTILTFQYDTKLYGLRLVRWRQPRHQNGKIYSTRITMINREGKTWQQRDDNTAFP